jgi:hypothetical protein
LQSRSNRFYFKADGYSPAADQLEEARSMAATYRLSRALAATVSACALSLAWPTAAETVNPHPPLAAHRAIYELSLLKTSGAKAPAAVRGRISFDFTGSVCDGYTQNFRQITELQPSEGANRLSDMRSSTFEAADAKDYTFTIQTKVDSSTAEDIAGRARKNSDAQLSVDLSKPKQARVALSGAAFFPTEHLQHILAAARSGENLLEAKVFDGTGNGEKIFDSLTVIGKPTTAPPSEKAAQIDALKSQRRWPVAISYFEPGKRDQQPTYVLSFDLYENGVSRALKLDYGDFILAGEMTQLEILPPADCKKK